jgi:exonuclease III
MKEIDIASGLILVCLLYTMPVFAQSLTSSNRLPGRSEGLTRSDPVARFDFERNINAADGSSIKGTVTGKVSYVKGVDGSALRIRSEDASGMLTLKNEALRMVPGKDFSVEFWVKTSMDPGKTAVILSQKKFPDNSIASQRDRGWVFYCYEGTWAWNLGSGTRRLTHERENGKRMPLNDGKWHQLAMTYNSELEQIKLFYDGDYRALYNVSDSVGFDFTNDNPIIAGWQQSNINSMPEIEQGAKKLQDLVNAFHMLGLGSVEPAAFETLIVEPSVLFNQKVNEIKKTKGADSLAFLETTKTMDFVPVTRARAELMKSPYTVHQIREFMELAPLLKIYSLVDGTVTINQTAAKSFIESEKLSRPDFDMDNLAIWERVLSPDEVRNAYAKFFKPAPHDIKETLTTLTAANWNIWHGGKHFTVAKDGWDSRVRIAEMLKKENADIIMMQETYSSGDFIAAELGYYFASTVDWDYLNQGANISVLSRYPIKELYVPKGAPFMNVAVKVQISKSQDIYVMSNWYGMNQFPAVFNFHEARFAESDNIPTIFAGDFNAVPHTDGGNSPASVRLLEAGFTDAYRNLYPDVIRYPGFSHRQGKRIDQLYYKGNALKNTSTKVIGPSTARFPSDHSLIISTFNVLSRISEK